MSDISYNDKTWRSYTLPKEILKTVWITCHISWVLLSSAIFTGNQKILLNQEIQIRFHLDTQFLILLTFLESIRALLTNMVTILMMLAKMATLGLDKTKIFWKKGYSVIIFVNDITSRILSGDSNYNVNVVRWP